MVTKYINRFKLEKLDYVLRISCADANGVGAPDEALVEKLAMAHGDAISLRDALIKIYPLEKGH